MKRFLFLFSLLLMAAGAFAQPVHFVYLQSDTHKPFYVRLDQKTFSSSSIGYVILPKLQNGQYSLRIGFARSDAPEQEFLLQVADNDQGFLIKDFGDKGLGLFNLQTLAVQYGGETQQLRQQAQQKAAETRRLQEAAALQRRNDSLQAVAAAVRQRQVADSLLTVAEADRLKQYNDSLQQALAASVPKNKQDTILVATSGANQTDMVALEKRRIEKMADSIATAQAMEIRKQNEAAKNMGNTIAEQPLPIDSVPPHMADVDAPVQIQRTFTDSGWHYTYVVAINGKRENVAVFIPSRSVKGGGKAENPPLQHPGTTPATPPAENKPVTNEVTAIKPSADSIAVQPQGNITFLNFSIEDTAKPTTKVLPTSNCRATADENDFLNARKKIAAAKSTDDMITAARKLMKEKCYSTEQIRNLSYLFLTDGDRYRFLDAAYPFATDAYRFNTLQDLLKDDYYVQRFKTMLR